MVREAHRLSGRFDIQTACTVFAHCFTCGK